MTSPIRIEEIGNIDTFKRKISEHFSCPCHTKTVNFLLPSGDIVSISLQLTLNIRVHLEEVVVKTFIDENTGLPFRARIVVQGVGGISSMTVEKTAKCFKNNKAYFDYLDPLVDKHNKTWGSYFPVDHLYGQHSQLDLEPESAVNISPRNSGSFMHDSGEVLVV